MQALLLHSRSKSSKNESFTEKIVELYLLYYSSYKTSNKKYPVHNYKLIVQQSLVSKHLNTNLPYIHKSQRRRQYGCQIALAIT